MNMLKTVRLGDFEWTLGETPRISHLQAQHYAEAIGSGWRLPSSLELLSLLNHNRLSPAINLELFPNCRSYYYWTSTPYAGYAGSFWVVDFNLGYTYWHDEQSRFYVRYIRKAMR